MSAIKALMSVTVSSITLALPSRLHICSACLLVFPVIVWRARTTSPATGSVWEGSHFYWPVSWRRRMERVV